MKHLKMHIILSICTFGMWLPVWFVCILVDLMTPSTYTGGYKGAMKRQARAQTRAAQQSAVAQQQMLANQQWVMQNPQYAQAPQWAPPQPYQQAPQYRPAPPPVQPYQQ